MKRVHPSSFRLWCALGLTWSILPGCSTNIPAPWHVEIMPVLYPITARYDDEGMLHVISRGEDGVLHYGIIDPESESRIPQDLGAITVGGSTVVDYNSSQTWVDLAPRPGTDEMWAFVNGIVGRFNPGSANLATVIDLTAGAYGPRGGLFFEDKDTLHTGAEGLGWRIYPIDGSGNAGEMTLLQASTEDGGVTQMPAPCQIEIVNGFAYAQPCEWLAPVKVDLAEGTYETGGTTFDDAYDYLRVESPIAVSEEWGLHEDLSFYCLLPLEEHGLMIAERDRKVNDQFCDGYQYFGAGVAVSRADVAPEGGAFVLIHDRAAMVLVQDDKPEGFNKDKTGTWCPFYLGGAFSSVTFAADGTLQMQHNYGGGTEILYSEWGWSQSGEKLTTTFKGQATQYENYGDEKFVHWARRSGITLVIRSTTDQDSTQHMIDSGFTSLSGVYYLCGE